MSVGSQFFNNILQKKRQQSEQAGTEAVGRLRQGNVGFASHPALVQVRFLQKAAERLGLADPFFRIHEAGGGARTIIGGKEYINFSHYNYLGLNGSARVNAAAAAALARYGTSAGASRLVAGERPVQRELEKELAALYGVSDAVVFVSGHATNVSAISTLCGPGDLILHDSLIHNSVLEGATTSGATRRPFPHNNMEALANLLASLRKDYKNALIVVEGLYSMDGDLPNLPELLRLKENFGAWLMVDEAHSLGTLGKSGKGLAEHWNVDASRVDIWMGTLSKTLASCGGFIAGCQDLIDLLKATAPGFVYSVGISPPLAAASLEALRAMRQEPERVERLAHNARFFMEKAGKLFPEQAKRFGTAIAPFVIGSSRKAIELSSQLFDMGINVQPIIHPAVEEKASRLRFFLSSEHTEDDMEKTLKSLASIYYR